jgi:CheY-like chemotaxis protein
VVVAFLPVKGERAAVVLEVACELLAWHRARTDGLERARPMPSEPTSTSSGRLSVKVPSPKTGPRRSSTPSPRDRELEMGAQRLSARLGRTPHTPSVVAGLLRELGHDETAAMSIVTYALSKGILERRGSGLASARRPLVLVVDDDPEARHIVERVLRQEDFDVMTAPDGRAALEIARRVRPDFIVLDLVMPVMNGWQLLAELRADPELAKVPIAVASAVSPKQPPPPEAVDVLQKPLDFYRLVTSIEIALRQEGNVRSVVVDC